MVGPGSRSRRIEKTMGDRSEVRRPSRPTQRSRWAAPFIARARVCMVVGCGVSPITYHL